MPIFLAKKHTGMRVDHSGILGRIAKGCKVRQDQRWILGQMDEHLEEMAKRFYAGEISAVDEFLQLYCLDDARPSERQKEAEFAEGEDRMMRGTFVGA